MRMQGESYVFLLYLCHSITFFLINFLKLFSLQIAVQYKTKFVVYTIHLYKIKYNFKIVKFSLMAIVTKFDLIF